MKRLNALFEKFAAAAVLLIASEQVLAGGVGVITHSPFTTSIPVLGGAGLVVLSALLGLVSLRFLKERHLGGGNFLVVATLAGALAAGGSGFKLISDANAIDEGLQLSEADGGQITIPGEGFNTVFNGTGSTQIIDDISLSPGCSLEVFNGGNGGLMNGGNGGNGGSFKGDCSDNPGTVLDNLDFCQVLVCCLNGGGNGGCPGL